MSIETAVYDDWLEGKACSPATVLIDLASQQPEPDEPEPVYRYVIEQTLKELARHGGKFSDYDILAIARRKLREGDDSTISLLTI